MCLYSINLVLKVPMKGTPLGPKYMLYGHVEPEGKGLDHLEYSSCKRSRVLEGLLQRSNNTSSKAFLLQGFV